MAFERISVAIVDDHLMVAEGLAEIIQSESDLEVSGIAGSVQEGLALVERTQPDVVLMDYHLPDGDGGSATTAILARWPEISVIMLTGSGAEEALARAIEAGCAGFLVKELRGLEIAEAVRAVRRGELVIHAGSLHAALPNLRQHPINPHELTHRETEVLSLLATGISTEALAQRLFLSAHTVRNHVRNVLTKLGAHSKLEAVAIAAREHLISLEAVP